MRKSAFAAGALLLAFCVGLSSGVKGQSNEVAEFIKLLNEAENSFLDEEYEKVKTILETAEEILERYLEAPIEKSLSQWTAGARASSEYSPTNWSAKQATGEPNTSECGDIATAWAPASSDSGAEWLELAFGTPVYATELRVHETLSAGFIYKVELVDVYQKRHIVWQGEDTTPCPGWFEIDFEKTRYLAKSVILHTQTDGYEEIDAVELTGIPVSR